MEYRWDRLALSLPPLAGNPVVAVPSEELTQKPTLTHGIGSTDPDLSLTLTT